MKTAAVANDPGTPAKSRKGGVRWGFVVCSVLAAGALLGAKYFREQWSRPPELRTVPVERRDLRITIGTGGTIEPREVVEVGAGVAGRILQFGTHPDSPDQPLDVGSPVRQGMLLVQLESDSYQVAQERAAAAMALADAELGRLRTQLAQAARNLERAARLRPTNSESEYDRIHTAHALAKSELEIGIARLNQAKAEAKQAEIHLTKTAIRSPIDGILVDRRANVGQNVLPGGPGLFLIAKDLDRMRIRASVSETDIGKVYSGQPVSFTVDAYRDRPMTGHVERIQLNARMQGNFVTYDVLVAIDSVQTKLLPHMTADVQFEVLRREDAWLVPAGSLRWWPEPEQLPPGESPPERPAYLAHQEPLQEGQQGIVWLPIGDGCVRPLVVQIGVEDGAMTEVSSEGMQEHLPVVVGSAQRRTLARIIPSAKTIR